jgi:hypothetical protein
MEGRMMDRDPGDASAWGGSGRSKPNGAGTEAFADLADTLSGRAWLQRELPPPERLLGDLLTTTSRVFLVGPTGLGKTLLALRMAVGMARGIGFPPWHSVRAARVLYIDGEMPAELMKTRIADAARSAGCEHSLDTLFVYSRDWAEELAKLYPTLGILEPLNTEQGQTFIRQLCDIIRPDVIVLDNVQALITGDLRDEVPWTETLPLVTALTTRRIGQLWCDHTGWNTARQYGSSTKAWRFDSVGIMTPLSDDDRRQRHEVAFTLSFDPPAGKARRRTPDNWEEFSPHIIRLCDGRWTSEPTDPAAKKVEIKVTPMDEAHHSALLDALAITSTPGETTHDAWFAECVRRGLVPPIQPEDDYKARERKRGRFRVHKAHLVGARWVGCDGERVFNLRRNGTHPA